jgi:uncharacterized repeat protein (TIGR03803 family)
MDKTRIVAMSALLMLAAGCAGRSPATFVPGTDLPVAARSTTALDGEFSAGGLLDVGGVLYGTTFGGGAYGGGTIFSIAPTGANFRVIHSFGSGKDGAEPAAGLLRVGGALYGTTAGGGARKVGTIFRIAPDGTNYRVLYGFINKKSGEPKASVIRVGGLLYGTTVNGGVFRISTAGKHYTQFTGGSEEVGDGSFGSLVDDDGTLYGTTSNGGGPNNAGTVFSLTTGGVAKVLHSFNTNDGVELLAGLISVNGRLYGTAACGGTQAGLCSQGGTAFSVTPDGHFTLLHRFGNGGDGGSPSAALLNANGILYGTTVYGGGHGAGTVFSLTLAGIESVVHRFNGHDGFGPQAPLINVRGTLYGTTWAGGVHHTGTIFSVGATGENFKVLHNFGPE